MSEMFSSSIFFGVLISLIAYEIGLLLKSKFQKAIFNPVLIAILFVITFLLIFDIDYESYEAGAKYLSYLLTPTTVCLAIPLYRQLALLKNNLKAILLGVLSVVFASLGSILMLSFILCLSHEQYVTLLPKSITAAISMPLSQELGGLVTITVAATMITGIFGNMIADSICEKFKIEEPIAKGVAIGTASHAIGSAKALEMGPIEGAMSSLAIVVSGLVTVLAASVFATFM